MYKNREELLAELYALSDDDRAKFNTSISGGNRKHLGVRIPELRSIAKRENADANYDFLSVLGDEYFEEAMLRGLFVAGEKIPFNEKEKAIFDYIPYVDNWALVDCSVSTLKIRPKQEKEYLSLAKNLISDGREYAVRYGFVILLDYYVKEEYLDLIFSLIESVPLDDYMVSMAVAWLVSVCAVKYPDITENYLKHAKIDDLTYNRAIRKICDSFRTDKQYKERLKLTKRKISSK